MSQKKKTVMHRGGENSSSVTSLSDYTKKKDLVIEQNTKNEFTNI